MTLAHLVWNLFGCLGVLSTLGFAVVLCALLAKRVDVEPTTVPKAVEPYNIEELQRWYAAVGEDR